MPSTLMRDSSADYRTYWLQDGQYYSKMKNLGDSAPCVLPADKVAQIPEADRKAILIETSADPVFCAKIARVMTSDPDWVHTIVNSAKRAIANEMNRNLFPESRGTWPKLREMARNLVDDVSAAVRVGRAPLAVKSVSGLGGLGNLGQWDIIAGLVGSIGGAAANVYGASVTARAQESIARTQANAAIQAAQANMAIVNAQTAMQNAQASMNPVSSAFSAITSANIAGIPIIALAIPAIGLIIYLATKK